MEFYDSKKKMPPALSIEIFPQQFTYIFPS